MTRGMGARVPLLLFVGIAVALSVRISRPAQAASSRECVTARVEAPFRLPDGDVRPAGTLTLCGARAFSPVADVHVVLVDRRPVGVYVGRKSTPEAAGAEPQMVFERNEGGVLDLIGYTLPASGRNVAYRLRGSSLEAIARIEPRVAPPAAPSLGAGAPAGDTLALASGVR